MRNHDHLPRIHCRPPLPHASLALFALLALLGGACLEPPLAGGEADEAQTTTSSELVGSGTLQFVRERKISQIIPLSGINDYEASGVQLHGGQLYIVFDNMTQIGRVALDLQSGSYASGGSSSTESQYEGITFDDNVTQHFYTVVEQAAAEVVQYDSAASGSSAVHQSTNVTLTDGKGFEGIAWLRRNNNDYLLGLCEGYGCTTSHGGSGGRGAIRVMAQTGSSWTADPTFLFLPVAVRFKDYSDLALLPNTDGTYKVAVTSQESKALWIGRLSATSWSFLDDGTIYPLPSSDYCNVEGVTFLSASRVALVSDASDPLDGDPPGCNNKDEMVHIFDLQ
jgi:hypothetical protein